MKNLQNYFVQKRKKNTKDELSADEMTFEMQKGTWLFPVNRAPQHPISKQPK
jgi:hypothetical protein